jgi:secreted trypsin-like serine protease
MIKKFNLTGLIVGGVNVMAASDFPHMAAIGYADFNGGISFKCGASLISELFALSVAHCQTADRTPASVIRLGALNLKVRDVNSPEVDIPIALFINHEAYNKDTRENDIAVIKMSKPAIFSANIRPACLQFTNNLPKSSILATGWGTNIIDF